ncbi:IS3 family transposase [Streptomyces sp. NPDC002159]
MCLFIDAEKATEGNPDGYSVARLCSQARSSYAHCNSPVLQRPVELAEYTSREYRTVYDNAAAESFFGLLKAEIGTTVWESHEAARADLFRFIEVEYNRTRLRKHPEYGYVTPLETRALATQDLTPAA